MGGFMKKNLILLLLLGAQASISMASEKVGKLSLEIGMVAYNAETVIQQRRFMQVSGLAAQKFGVQDISTPVLIQAVEGRITPSPSPTPLSSRVDSPSLTPSPSPTPLSSCVDSPSLTPLSGSLLRRYPRTEFVGLARSESPLIRFAGREVLEIIAAVAAPSPESLVISAVMLPRAQSPFARTASMIKMSEVDRVSPSTYCGCFGK